MNNEEQSITAASALEPAAGLVQRINMVFFSPGKLGEHLRQASPWFWTLAIVAIVSTIAWALIPTDIMRQMIEAQAAGRPQAQGGGKGGGKGGGGSSCPEEGGPYSGPQHPDQVQAKDGCDGFSTGDPPGREPRLDRAERNGTP